MRVQSKLQHSKDSFMKVVNVVHLGITDYKTAWDLQRKSFDLRIEGKITDTVIMNEHHHVYTIGKSGDQNHLLAGVEELKEKGADVFFTDRGGDVTYHGPGQLVGYPILRLGDYYLDVHRYLRDIEELIIRTLSEYGIEGSRDENLTGVWVGNEKIAAIGVKVSHWVTMHGFALNVNTDLSYFERIIPCGIFHKGVTSMNHLLGKSISLDEVSSRVLSHFGEVFNVEIRENDAPAFMQSLDQLIMEKEQCLQTAT